MGLVDGNGRPLVNFSSIADGLPLTIFGKPVISNLDMPVPALGAKSVLFGDLSQYKVRFVNDLMIIRQQESLASKGQIGFVALWRADANLADAGTHPVAYFQGGAT
jgi:HK97 family phage major capsid protein